MEFKFYLIVIILTGSGPVVDTEDGWAKREQPDWKTCIERKAKFNQSRGPGGSKLAICRKVMVQK